MDVHVRDIDPEVWKAIRVEAIQQGVPVGKLIELLWSEWAKTNNGRRR